MMQFCTNTLIPVKASSLMRILKDINRTRLNPQMNIDATQRAHFYQAIFVYIQTIGIACPFNIALPYKLLYSLTRNDKEAMRAYCDKFMGTYSKQFLEYYLLMYMLLWVCVAPLTCSAYECDDTLVPDKSELCDRVMSLLQSYHCTGDELLGQIIEVCVHVLVDCRESRTRSAWWRFSTGL